MDTMNELEKKSHAVLCCNVLAQQRQIEELEVDVISLATSDDF